MKRYVLLGDPVAKSLSPVFQNAAFAAAGLAARYEARRVGNEAELRAAIDELRKGTIAGANVTIPWKREALALADEVTPEAAGIGAANWLGLGKEGKVVADNTDAEGLRRAMREAGVAAEVRASGCVVLGAGGAARAAVVALKREGAGEIVVGARNLEAARGAVGKGTRQEKEREKEEAEERKAAGRGVELSEARRIAEVARVVVSAVPEAAWGDVAPAKMSGCLVDLAYAKGGTAAEKWAKERGVRAIGGLGMLLHQGALSFEKWTGVPFPMDAARAALG